jgi:predicted solute-binding protein
MARPGVVDQALYRLLHASRREGTRALDRIAEEFSWNGRRDPALARQYLTENIVYRFGSPELEALRLFFRVAHEHGIVERVPPLALALQRWSGCHETAAQLGLIR